MSPSLFTTMHISLSSDHLRAIESPTNALGVARVFKLPVGCDQVMSISFRIDPVPATHTTPPEEARRPGTGEVLDAIAKLFLGSLRTPVVPPPAAVSSLIKEPRKDTNGHEGNVAARRRAASRLRGIFEGVTGPAQVLNLGGGDYFVFDDFHLTYTEERVSGKILLRFDVRQAEFEGWFAGEEEAEKQDRIAEDPANREAVNGMAGGNVLPPSQVDGGAA